MDNLSLANLFDTPCFASCGEISGESENRWNLVPLASGETPKRYAHWAKKRQREFLAGRHHAKAALRNAGHIGDVGIPRDIDGVPLFPSGYSGSITHTGKLRTFAAAVVTNEPRALGLDVEARRCLESDLFEHILELNEANALFESSVAELPTESGERCLLAFSAKEAFYKCVYPQVRTFFGFKDVRFEVLSPGRFSVRLLSERPQRLPRFLQGRYVVSDNLIATGISWANGSLGTEPP